MTTPLIILHHFDESPFSEKIRIVFGLKDIGWTSVLISRIMPRPDLMPMTGGYRRTPVMQIGADIYCDSQCILRELERRFPEPSLLPDGDAGLGLGVGDVDRPFVLPEHRQPRVRHTRRQGPAGLHRRPRKTTRRQIRRRGDDSRRSRKCATSFAAICNGSNCSLPTAAHGSAATRPRLFDVNAYMNVWYVRQNMPNGDALLAEFGHVRAWETRMRAIGHGRRSEMSTADALGHRQSRRPADRRTSRPPRS